MRIHTVSPSDSFSDPGREYRASEPGVPLRCCLRKSLEAEPVWLFRYSPSSGKGPYAEVGPVFTHVDCPEAPLLDRLPVELLNNPRILRSYNAAGQIVDGEVAEPGSFDRVIAGLLNDPAIESVQVRSVSHGCFFFAVTRA
ncbi:Protein of unknown function [Lentzea albidocapillata subsp. violacea]|uniref:DUF1203 domain-containing protein n=1 Tax=Lentzea albidocapillata subsp. violacea TaxID=128104 RepID=A0A1G9HRB3_9PSEU|nr:DUF1203 domain-containing protein [Lentzea albidocapillata]SDL15103.1 Protein of unknown function [Lentzea albidocapillata subsp. violacea]